jgi:hypothetical protein
MITEVPMESLQTRHEELETRLELELSRPLPDQALIVELKKQKLRIKDEIEGHSIH